MHTYINANKIFHAISVVFCISIPNLFSYDGLSVWYILYVVLILLITIASFIWTMIRKVESVYKFIHPTAMVLDVLNITLITFTNIVSVVYAIFLRRKSVVNVVKKLEGVERAFHEKFGPSEVNNAFTWLLVCTNVAVLLVVFADIHMVSIISVNVGDGSVLFYRYRLTTYVHMYMMSVSVLQIYQIARRVKEKFETLNTRMYEVLTVSNKNNNAGDVKQDSLNMLKFFMKTFDNLCDVIELVNKSYGLQIALVAWVTIVKIIQCMNYSFKVILQKSIVLELNLSVYSYCLSALWSGLFIMLSMLLATACGQATEKAKETFVVSYKLLIEMPACPKHVGQQKLREDLLLMAEHLGHRQVNFSALGFFNVDYTMLFTIFGSIASYIVITLQFD